MKVVLVRRKIYILFEKVMDQHDKVEKIQTIEKLSFKSLI